MLITQCELITAVLTLQFTSIASSFLAEIQKKRIFYAEPLKICHFVHLIFVSAVVVVMERVVMERDSVAFLL